MKYKKKLIEVALPLEEINAACLKESSVPRRGHTSTLHPWWAKRPLAACAAVIFSQIIDDPGNNLNDKDAEKERKRLFKILIDYVKWENRNDKRIINKAVNELKKNLPKEDLLLIDPFGGRGNIPFEGQRLGLKVLASDYNPVATIIEKGVIEIPPKFLGQKPINPNSKTNKLSGNWDSCKGLADDLKYFGTLVDEKAKIILAPLFTTSDTLNPSVFLWMRIVKCPNPACNAKVPLTASFWLSKRKGKETYLNPIIQKNKYYFEIVKDKKDAPKSTVSRTGATCLCCKSNIPLEYIRDLGRNNKIEYELIATIEDTKKGRVYRIASDDEKTLANNIKIDFIPEGKIPEKALGFRIQKYGITDFSQLFSKRQLKVLTTYSEIISNLEKYYDFSSTNQEYVNALKVYLTFALDKLAAWNSTLCSWIPTIEGIKWTFPRQTLQMSWDFTEINPLATPPGNWLNHIKWVASFLESYPGHVFAGTVKQLDATATITEHKNLICSTDPPYYDNIGYANLSDFFYIWMRKSLKKVYPEIFSTVMSPKMKELISEPGRFDGDKSKAENHFEKGMYDFFNLLSKRINPNYPITVYYAFKQEELEKGKGERRSSTGWEKMLMGLLNSGFSITGTWPMRTERAARQRGNNSNALASSIIIVCRLRPESASISTRREFIKELKKDIPSALKNLQDAGIVPVDMAQSAIGPGMAVFSKYSKVLEADGTPMSVRTALQIINQELDSFFTEQESEMDRETRFCVAWYEQFGWKAGPFGDANTLSTAKGTAVNALETAEVISAKAGKVRLLKRSELDDGWDPTTDKKLTVWECVQHLIKKLDEGEVEAAKILRKIGGLAESVKELTYRLYSMCEKKGWTEDGLAYNSLISSWQSVTDKAHFAEQVSEETKKKLKDKSQKTLNDL
ncbi:DUF1156 domain-containing protein [Nanoarchaeota archaeon]